MKLRTTALSCLLYLGTLVSAVPTARATCNKYVLVDTRGTDEPQGPSSGFPGVVNQTLAAIPGGTVYNTVYPAADKTEALGGADIINYISNGLSQCPQQTYALLGYSQGATATAIAINHFNDTRTAAFKAIKAVFIIGNPAHKPNQRANLDQNGGKATYGAQGVLYSSVVHISDAWYATTKLVDVCYTDDIVCVGLTLGSLLNLGANHLLYGTTASVQNIGANFVINLLR